MKPKKNLRLRKIGSQYMITEASDENVNMTKVYELNETAASIWKWMSEGVLSAEELAGRLCENYEVEKEMALSDVAKQLEEWKTLGLLDEA